MSNKDRCVFAFVSGVCFFYVPLWTKIDGLRLSATLGSNPNPIPVTRGVFQPVTGQQKVEKGSGVLLLLLVLLPRQCVSMNLKGGASEGRFVFVWLLGSNVSSLS